MAAVNLAPGYRQSLWWLLGVITAIGGGLMVAGVLHWEPWGDERHFAETVRLFANEPTLATLRTYPEMSGPLPFALYALWGMLAGLELPSLRVLSLLIAPASYLLCHRIVWLVFRNGIAALLLTLFLALHPYMIGFSVFVFTDGPAILFVLIALLGAVRDRPMIVFVGLAGALLSRQYLVFLPAAIIGWTLTTLADPNQRRPAFELLVAALVATLPLALLTLLWGGLSPDNNLRRLYLNEGLSFHPDFLVLYISLLFLYLLPVVAFSWRQVYGDWRVNAVALVLGPSYFLFPVGASPYARDIGVHTVGLFHKALVALNGPAWIPHAVFFLGFVLGLPIVIQVVRSAHARIRAGQRDLPLLLDLSILLFLIVMPFSYLNWEKYLLPLVPLAAIRIAALRLPIASPTK